MLTANIDLFTTVSKLERFHVDNDKRVHSLGERRVPVTSYPSTKVDLTKPGLSLPISPLLKKPKKEKHMQTTQVATANTIPTQGLEPHLHLLPTFKYKSFVSQSAEINDLLLGTDYDPNSYIFSIFQTDKELKILEDEQWKKKPEENTYHWWRSRKEMQILGHVIMHE